MERKYYLGILIALVVVLCVSAYSPFRINYQYVRQTYAGDTAVWAIDGDTFRLSTNLKTRIPGYWRYEKIVQTLDDSLSSVRGDFPNNYWYMGSGFIGTNYDVNLGYTSIDTADIGAMYVTSDTVHGPDGRFYLWPTDTGRIALVGQGGMLWPAAPGIVTYTGETWGASIANNSANWNSAYTYRVTSASATAPLTLSLSSNAISGSIPKATSSQDGYLDKGDWATFNAKQSALTNPITGYGIPGRVAVFNGNTTLASYRLATINGATLLDSVDIALPVISSDTTEFTTTIDLSVNKIYYRTLTGSGNVSISVSNLAANRCATVKLVTNSYSGTITFVGGVGENVSGFSIVSTGVTYFDIQGVNTNHYIIKNIQEL